MRRKCDGNDLNLLRKQHEDASCVEPDLSYGGSDASVIVGVCPHYRPCSCGLEFDDVERSTVYPHYRIPTRSEKDAAVDRLMEAMLAPSLPGDGEGVQYEMVIPPEPLPEEQRGPLPELSTALLETDSSVDPADCPKAGCDGHGRKEYRLSAQGRIPYRCGDCGELWIDAEEQPRDFNKDIPIASDYWPGDRYVDLHDPSSG